MRITMLMAAITDAFNEIEYWVWDRRRRRLEDRVRRAAEKLLAHAGALGMTMPLRPSAAAGEHGEVFITKGGRWPR